VANYANDPRRKGVIARARKAGLKPNRANVDATLRRADARKAKGAKPTAAGKTMQRRPPTGYQPTVSKQLQPSAGRPKGTGTPGPGRTSPNPGPGWGRPGSGTSPNPGPGWPTSPPPAGGPVPVQANGKPPVGINMTGPTGIATRPPPQPAGAYQRMTAKATGVSSRFPKPPKKVR
jgi:hypothetical protein